MQLPSSSGSIAALSALGALLGAILGVLLKDRLELRGERRRERETLVRLHLIQLQDAVESLWYRFNNIVFRGGRFAMDDEYFVVTMLYAMGRVLAIERILDLKGMGPQNSRHYKSLEQHLRTNRLDAKLQDIGFLRYYRLAL